VASCTQIENLLQAYIDGELGQSDRVILEQHVADCRACAALLRRHQRTCANLFEVFSEDRLARSLVSSVFEHLPEMERDRMDVRAINWRAKHPVNRWHMVARFLPTAVGVILVILALAIVSQWPASPAVDSTVIGVVTHCSGAVKCSTYDSAVRQAVAVKDFVRCGQRYETDSGQTLMLTLAGPTQLKLNEDTRVKLYDDRKISVETGEIWLDVSSDGRLFRVNTPTGGITVFGTAFEIEIERDKTIVTVAKGKVQVENEIAFREIEPGQQVDLVIGRETLVPREVDVATETAWTEPIQPDQSASDLFEREILSRSKAKVPSAPVYYAFTKSDNYTRAVNGIYLEWELDQYPTGHCGYDVYVSDSRQKTPLFKKHISASVFADKKTRSHKMVSERIIRDVDVLEIKIVPDFSSGEIETSFTNVSAIGI